MPGWCKGQVRDVVPALRTSLKERSIYVTARKPSPYPSRIHSAYQQQLSNRQNLRPIRISTTHPPTHHSTPLPLQIARAIANPSICTPNSRLVSVVTSSSPAINAFSASLNPLTYCGVKIASGPSGPSRMRSTTWLPTLSMKRLRETL